jgi:hypothetical protein
MKDLPENNLPPELESVAARLRANRAQSDPLQRDQLKRRLMAGSRRQGRVTLMKHRLATLLTILGLVGGTGAALAVAGKGNGGGNGGAASGQYKPGKGCGDKNHTHTGPPGQNDNDADNSSGVNNGSAPDGDKDDCK